MDQTVLVEDFFTMDSIPVARRSRAKRLEYRVLQMFPEIYDAPTTHPGWRGVRFIELCDGQLLRGLRASQIAVRLRAGTEQPDSESGTLEALLAEMTAFARDAAEGVRQASAGRVAGIIAS